MPQRNGLAAGGLTDEKQAAIRRYRHERLRRVMRERNLPAVLAYDPVNIRYVTDARNMQVYSLNNDCRYVMVLADGPTVLFEWKNTVDFFRGLPATSEVRAARTWGFMAEGDGAAGDNRRSPVEVWADEIADLVREHHPDDPRIGVDRLGFRGVDALARRGITVVDGQGALYRARAVKSDEELDAVRISIAACEDGFDRMRSSLKPGMTEVEVWALLHQANVEWRASSSIPACSAPGRAPIRGCRRRACGASRRVTLSPATPISSVRTATAPTSRAPGSRAADRRIASAACTPRPTSSSREHRALPGRAQLQGN